MAFRTFADTDEAAAYAASLDERWPDRAALKAHLSSRLGVGPTAHIVEFCAGAGALAAQLFADHPHITYTGIDITAPLLNLARTRLASHARQITWLEADLNEDGWLNQLATPVHAFMSLQSLHDLGDESAVARIFGLAAQHLAPQGQFIYADMLAVEPPEENINPGRLRAERHLELLQAAGFASAICTWKIGPFGCFYAQLV
ncbi:MAG: class I SAM-dependent methyltransferase [Caldilineaceae bacterium]|nr:class I SAM-dependent methyltransferase [Caldilineaceae bacterium]